MPYPLAFEKDVLSRPKNIKFKNTNLVLWKAKNKIVCMPDKCSHRNAKLSEGIVVKNKIECPYHGWTFSEAGSCTSIPQIKSDVKIPKACNVPTFPVTNYDGIIWYCNYTEIDSIPTFEKEFKKFYITDKSYYLPYSYQLQIENLLDPAHLHFVHDGFQGNKQNACPIKLTSFYENEKEIYGYFVHLDNTTPDLSIRFIKPGIVDVSVIDKNNHRLIRKNVIYVSPGLDDTCNVLFRDITMSDTFLKIHENTIFKNNVFESKYKLLNTTIIDLITDQDIKIIKSQTENIKDYCTAKYVLPGQSDRMIIAFRKWFCSTI
jgi:phenylpropionate dioxygenase-like ring-hydroxylating dioxygenase large terminal subunit